MDNDAEAARTLDKSWKKLRACRLPAQIADIISLTFPAVVAIILSKMAQNRIFPEALLTGEAGKKTWIVTRGQKKSARWV